MKFLVFCLALTMGGLVLARPEPAEESPVAASEPKAQAVAPKPAEGETDEEEESTRFKRFYFHPGNFGYGYFNRYNPGFGNSFHNMQLAAGGVGVPIVSNAIQGRTGDHRYGMARIASFNELMNHNRFNDLWGQQGWRNPNFQGGFPDVIDTSAFNQGFNQGFNNQGFNNQRFNHQGFNNNNFNRPGFNQANNQPDVIDTASAESRTRFGAGRMNNFHGFQGQFFPGQQQGWPNQGWNNPGWNQGF